MVLSKASKKEAKKKEKMKRIHFSKPIVQSPPKVLHHPSFSITFGAFSSQVDPSNLPRRSIFGSPAMSQRDLESNNGAPTISAPSEEGTHNPVLNSNSKSLGRQVKCFRCFHLGHIRCF